MPKVLVVDDNPELLALLSSALEEAGYAVQTAQRGRNALDFAKRERPDLAVIDVLLPDVMGFEVAEALRKMKVPFVFMSGVHKGGKAASNAIGKYGAAGYFEKPFQRKQLLELVEQLVPVQKPEAAAQAWDVEGAPGVDDPAEAMELTGRIDLTSGKTQSSIKGESVNLRATSSGIPSVASTVPPAAIDRLQIRRSPVGGTPPPPVMAPVMAPVAPPARPQAPFPADEPLAPLGEVQLDLEAEQPVQAPERRPAASWGRSVPPPPPPDISQPLPVVQRPDPSDRTLPQMPPPPQPEALQDLPVERGAIHRGELRDNLPQLLAAFAQAQEDGELGLQRGQVKKIIYFEKGMPVFALSNLVADRLGQFLVRAGKIDEETLRHAAQEAHDTQQRTGDVLILMGLLTEQERLYYVGQQIKSILYSLFAWEEGYYQLSFQERARKESIKLDIAPATLVMRGIKKLYKPERLGRILRPDDRPLPGPDPLFALSDVELSGWEAQIIARCDGTRTVRDLIVLSGKPEQETLGTLVGLVSMRILETRSG